MNMTTILDKIKSNPDKFSDEFHTWIQDNEPIFHAFCTEALKVHNRGRKHYSARTIVEFLRHHTTLQEKDGVFKINDHCVPYMARLFDLMFPHAKGLFEYRKLTFRRGMP
jgi:hypothetical protein